GRENQLIRPVARINVQERSKTCGRTVAHTPEIVCRAKIHESANTVLRCKLSRALRRKQSTELRGGLIELKITIGNQGQRERIVTLRLWNSLRRTSAPQK